MLKLYTDDSPGLRVYVFPLVLCHPILYHAFSVYVEKLLNVRQFGSDPFIVLVLSLSFIASIFFLHISAKIIRAFTK